MRAGFVIAGIASTIGVAVMIGIAISMVRAGHALETYRTFWLVEDDWVGLLAFVVCSFIAILGGLGYRVASRRRENREWRQQERKSG